MPISGRLARSGRRAFLLAALLCAAVAAPPVRGQEAAAPTAEQQRQADEEAAAWAKYHAQRRAELLQKIVIGASLSLIPVVWLLVRYRRRRRKLAPPPVPVVASEPIAETIAARAASPGGEPGPSEVFLSYASEDRARARDLARALEGQGWRVWWDRKILPGRSFGQVIEEQLDSVKCVLVLWSKASVASDWVEAEAARARQRGILVPVLIDDVGSRIPIEFSRLHAANLQHWQGDANDEEFRELVAAIARHTGEPAR